MMKTKSTFGRRARKNLLLCVLLLVFLGLTASAQDAKPGKITVLIFSHKRHALSLIMVKGRDPGMSYSVTF